MKLYSVVRSKKVTLYFLYFGQTVCIKMSSEGDEKLAKID